MFNQYSYLYVEDDPLSRQIMQMIMQNVMGIRNLNIFESSDNFAERLRALEPRPRVFLLDIHVAPMNGFAMLDYVRQTPGYEDAIVIALTASVMLEELEEIQQNGFDSAIAKPISVMTFPGLIERILLGDSVWHVSDE